MKNKFIQKLIFSTKSLRSRKTRTFLTSFSVFIGVFIIVFLISLSNGAQKIIIEQITNQFDLKTLIVLKKGSLNTNFFSTTAQEEAQDTKILSQLDLDNINNIKNVNFAQPIVNIFQRKLEFKDKDFDKRVVTSASGGGWDLRADDNVVSEVYAGRFTNLEEDEIVLTNDLVDAYGKAYEEVIGKKVLLVDQPSLFGAQTKPIKMREYTVVGVINKIRNFVYIVSLNEGLSTVAEKNNYSSIEEYLQLAGFQSIYVKAKSEEFVKDIAEEIKLMGFDVSTLEDVLNLFNILFSIVPFIFTIIGGVAIFVASIGIVNTMIMSVFERTREIGVLKAIGAKNGDILTIFLLESSLIGLFGGVAAIILGVMSTSLINNFFETSIAPSIGLSGQTDLFIYDLSLFVFSFLLSLGVGIVAGLYPAFRASKLDPVEALKYE